MERKQAYCRYSDTLSFESAHGGVRLFLPTQIGYINYNIVHTVKESANADIWRLGQAFAVDDALQNDDAITPAGAEWDMAVRIEARDDFIGGYAHGDEVLTSGKGDIYPGGLVVGQIEGVFTDPSGQSRYAVIIPKAHLDELIEVFVIKEFDVVE